MYQLVRKIQFVPERNISIVVVSVPGCVPQNFGLKTPTECVKYVNNRFSNALTRKHIRMIWNCNKSIKKIRCMDFIDWIHSSFIVLLLYRWVRQMYMCKEMWWNKIRLQYYKVLPYCNGTGQQNEYTHTQTHILYQMPNRIQTRKIAPKPYCNESDFRAVADF